MLLLQTNYFEIPGYILAILGFAGAIAGALTTYIFMRSGLTEKKADGYQKLFEMEEIRANKIEKLNQDLKEENDAMKLENDSLNREYTALSQLFAKKSLMLEFFTGYTGKTVSFIDNGQYTILDVKPLPVNRVLLEKGSKDE